MVHEAAPIDASTMPDVSRLVREVARTGQARVIQADGDAAVLSPARRRRKTAKAMTREEFQAGLHATYGAWKGLIDPEEFKRQRQELQEDEREPLML
jgi:hypothetical protein